MSFFCDLSLKNKIQLPLLLGMGLLVVSLTLVLVFSTNQWLEHTLPGERSVQRMRGDTALLSSSLREYILTYDTEILDRVGSCQDKMTQGLAHLKEHMSGALLEELSAAGEDFLCASNEVIAVREQIQAHLDQMQKIEIEGAREWRKIRALHEDNKNSQLWNRMQDTLGDLGAAAEYFHFTVMNSVWTIRHESDLDISTLDTVGQAHHFERGRATLKQAMDKVEAQFEPFLKEHQIQLGDFVEQFIYLGGEVAKNSALLWGATRELERAEKDLDRHLERAAKNAVEETTRVVSTGRFVVFCSISVVFMLLALFLGLLARRISQALEELVNGASQFDLKNLSHRIPETCGDEVGDLARAFNAMAEKLERSILDLQRAEAEVMDKEREAAHEAGKGEMATTILHNVGNVLNSVMISTQMVEDLVTGSTKIQALARANESLTELEDGLQALGDAGNRLLVFYPRYLKLLESEDTRIVDHIRRISSKVELIRDVVRAQQGYARSGLQMEFCHLCDLVDDALALETTDMQNAGITVEKHYEDQPEVMLQRNKLTHVLLNVLRNARQAMTLEEKRLTVRIYSDANRAYVRVSDTGTGVEPENLEKIFQHGFTTKADGHGFGLHASANSMAEMDAGIWAESGGPGEGTCFVMAFPLTRDEPQEQPEK